MGANSFQRGLIRRGRAALWLCLWAATSMGGALIAAEREFAPAPSHLFEQFCFDCHGDEGAEANLNLRQMLSAPNFLLRFKTWEKVVAMLDGRKMPPDDMPQPTDAQRRQLSDAVHEALQRAAHESAGNPGRVVMRRLTSAEYAYSIRDLTGTDLSLDRGFVDDAVGGEGFANVGTVQFLQDSTLERYLEAAERIAAHAVIGAGPLGFFHDPGKTGFELSAINRIQGIYREHGFRTGAGEGAEPFGLDRYPRAFYVAWRYLHRQLLQLGDVSLATLAAEEGIDRRFVEHIWSVLSQPQPTSPTCEIVDKWRGLPVPGVEDGDLLRRARAGCDDVYQLLHGWQRMLAESSSHDDEEALVLTEGSFQTSPAHEFRARISWSQDESPTAVKVTLETSVISLEGVQSPLVVWQQPRVRFRRRGGGRRRDEQTLAALLSAESARQFAFGRHPRGRTVEAHAFVTAGSARLEFDLPVPRGAREAEFLVDVKLDLEQGEDGVVRCMISDGQSAATKRTAATLLANPDGAAFQSWKAGVLDFARLLPEVSHREPAPSDRDPIPAPFDNTYNARERDHFHTKVKYHRDDRFLVEHILDDATRKQLDQAWTDLLASFEYHDILLQFITAKHQLELGGRRVTELDEVRVSQLPEAWRKYVQGLRDEYESVQRALKAAEEGHVEDALRLANRAWRRPLTDPEKERLRSFYGLLRKDSALDHRQAIRALVARILVAPEFLYRVERPAAGEEIAPLAAWELASRLSYFLWSSLPDEELWRAAAAGELADSQGITHQAKRMLRDPKARRLATEFFGQWLGFYQFDRYRGVDPERFPEFTDGLKLAMYEEAVAFFEHIIRADRGVRDIWFADYAFLNRELAEHYAVEVDVAPARLPERVENVQTFHRGGLFGLGAVLTVTSAPLRTSPVKRGDWILRRVLGTPVPPPPPDAGSIAADDVRSDGLTVRARLEAHRRQPTCMNCHSRIDPPGFALEHYDAIGRWRDRYRDGQTIDDAGFLSDGTAIAGPEGLRQYLRSQEEQVYRTLCAKLLGYALGRGELASDVRLVEQMVEDVEADGRFSSLVMKIVTSQQFRCLSGSRFPLTPDPSPAKGRGEKRKEDS